MLVTAIQLTQAWRFGRGLAAEGGEEGRDHPGGEEHLGGGLEAVVGEQGRAAQRDGGADRERDRVTDDEVPPEAGERRQVAHGAVAPAGRAPLPGRRRHSETAAKETAINRPMSTGSMASSSCHSTPTPSPAQKVPKDVRRMPTTNLM